MNTNLENLKAIYIALGGNSTTAAGFGSNAEALNAIATLLNGDTSGATTNAELLEIIAGVVNGLIKPTGKIAITENGTDIDVAQYATADVDVPEGIQVAENYTVSEGKLTEADVHLVRDIVATIPDGVTEIGNTAFMGNILINKVIMPNSVTSIEDAAPWEDKYGCFNDCTSLNMVIFSNSLETIGSYAFNNCYALTSLTIPDSVTSIGEGAFLNCYALTSLTIPDSVTSIGESAFNNCRALTTLTIPNSVTSIGNYAFGYCLALTTLTIPDSVTSIGNNAFGNCQALTDIYYTGTQQQWEAITGISDAGFKGTETIHYEYTPET